MNCCVIVIETKGPKKRGRPTVKWKATGTKFMHERVANRGERIGKARRESKNREKWRLLYRRKKGRE